MLLSFSTALNAQSLHRNPAIIQTLTELPKVEGQENHQY